MLFTGVLSLYPRWCKAHTYLIWNFDKLSMVRDVSWMFKILFFLSPSYFEACRSSIFNSFTSTIHVHVYSCSSVKTLKNWNKADLQKLEIYHAVWMYVTVQQVWKLVKVLVYFKRTQCHMCKQWTAGELTGLLIRKNIMFSIKNEEVLFSEFQTFFVLQFLKVLQLPPSGDLCSLLFFGLDGTVSMRYNIFS